MLPIVATLLAQGLGLLGNAVMAKGKDVIEEKLGIDLEAAVQTEEGLHNLRQLEVDHEQFLLTNALENRKLDVANVTNARDSNVRIQESGNASWLAKNAIYIIAFIVIIGGGVILVTSKEADVRMAAVSCITLVLGFFYGTTQQNRAKDSTIASLAGGSK